MVLISQAGATHVAIDTPYDSQFLPVLQEWVASARAHGLSVWFRGNFSGWEGWFNYTTITPAEHETMLNQFILNSPNLFQSGDIFTPCPECENGGPGDPRQTGDTADYQKMLADEYWISNKDFHTIGKSVQVYFSMNGDIARHIMTPDSAQAVGGTLLVDQYDSSVAGFNSDLTDYSTWIGTPIGVGEFGAPIPNLNSNMTAGGQAVYVGGLLNVLANGIGPTGQTGPNGQSAVPPLVNYWDLKGGSTALVSDSGQPLPVYSMVKSYYTAPAIYGAITDDSGHVIPGVQVSALSALTSPLNTTSDNQGFYQIFLPQSYRTVTFQKTGYEPATVTLPSGFTNSAINNIVMTSATQSLFYKLKVFFERIKVHINALGRSVFSL